MACMHPWQAFKKIPHLGKGVTTRPGLGTGRLITLPCGQCIGCRMTRSQEWSTRLTHEASQHEDNSFLTLTFNDTHLPENYSVRVRDLQLFLKRLRKKVTKVRFFACGEYGDVNLRPHYHLAIFGYDFPDKMPWRKTKSGFITYRSELLEELWPFGHSEIGNVTPQSAAYIARYIFKKVNGDRAKEYYTRVHPLTGEIHQVEPEFITMSTRPGIGRSWYDEFSGDTFPSDFVVIEGARRPVPRYYTKQLQEAVREKLAAERQAKAKKHAANNTPDRLAVREEILLERAAKLERELE